MSKYNERLECKIVGCHKDAHHYIVFTFSSQSVHKYCGKHYKSKVQRNNIVKRHGPL